MEYKPISDSELKTIITEILEKNPDMRVGGIMGLIMKETSGKADGKKVSMIIQDIRSK